MKRHYTITIVEDVNDETFSFSLEGGGDTPMDMDNLSSLLVEVAQTIHEEEVRVRSGYMH